MENRGIGILFSIACYNDSLILSELFSINYFLFSINLRLIKAP